MLWEVDDEVKYNIWSISVYFVRLLHQSEAQKHADVQG